MGVDPASPEDYRRIWEQKPALRAVYEDIYRRIAARLADGPTLEVGGGSGNLKRFAGDIVATDIVAAPWLDAVCDAQALPFAAGAYANVTAFDVVHHIERPVRFLTEAARVLRPGGRLVVCEPAITPLSGPFYRWLHPEPVDMSADPLADGPLDPCRDPFDSNQGVPTLLLGRRRKALEAQLPALSVIEVERLSFLAYPLSGGFRPWSLLPAAAVSALLPVEWSLRRLLGPLAAFRLIGVLERKP